MLSDRVLAFEELPGKGLVDHGHLACCRGVLLRNGPAQDDFCAQGLEESWHHSRPSRARVFLGPRLRSALDANAVVPAISRHGRIECRRHHPHAGNPKQAIVNLPEQGLQLLRLVVAEHGINRGDVPAFGLESEILVLQIAQALAEQRRRGEQYQGHCGLPDDQRLLRPGAPSAHRTIGPTQRLDRVGMRGHPRRCDAKNYPGQCRDSQGEKQHRPGWRCIDGYVIIRTAVLKGEMQNQPCAGIGHGDTKGSLQ